MAWVPEANLNVGFRLTDHISASVGYNFLWVADVVRPGDQVDRVVNFAQTPLVGSAQPSALDCSTPSWAQELRQRSLETPAPASRDTDPNALPVLGQYRLLALVGRGGMGEVYRAEHLFMKRQVAVKVIAAHLLGDLLEAERGAVEQLQRAGDALQELG